ncbi:glycoside hydrolase family 88/105 protein [Ereboglobus luteus]|nr:glycoside hydrolase family 88 protein [Ereboglobus luteus]
MGNTTPLRRHAGHAVVFAALFSLGGIVAAPVLTAASVAPEYPIPYVVPEASEVEASVARIHGYVVAHSSFRVIDKNTGLEIKAPDFEKFAPDAVIDPSLGAFNRWDYPIGVILTSFDHLATVTGKDAYREHGRRFFEYTFTWMPWFRAMQEKTGKRNDYTRMVRMAALDHCGAITASLIRAHMRQPDPRFRAWINVVDDYISHKQFRFEDGTLARQRPQARSLWTDDMYMGVSFLVQMGRLTGDAKYWHDAVRQVVQLSARLFDRNQELYDHGWSENMAGYDPRFYWGRANGWAVLAMAELLSGVPEDFPGRAKVLDLFQRTCRRLVELQDGGGLWHNLLDRGETYLETSASAMFTFALARGVNEGWLSPLYAPTAITGWNGVAARILEDGRVSGICEGTTYAHDSTYYFYRGAGSDTTFIGTVVYAGAEIIQLLNNPRVQITRPKPNAVNSAMQVRAMAAD